MSIHRRTPLRQRRVVDTRAPWMYPVPLRRASFRATVDPSNEKFGVLADVRTRPVFRSVASAVAGIESELVGFADFRASTVTPSRCFGASGSIYFEGKHIDGVGRTPLDARAESGSDALRASDAVRTMLTTAYVRAQGLADAIVPCEDVLWANREHDRGSASSRRSSSPSALAIDDALRAVCITPGDFVRPENLAWMLLNHVDYSHFSEPRHLMMSIGRYADLPSSEERGATEELDVDAAFALLARAFERAFFAVLRTNWLGFSWSDVRTRVTLDGRIVIADGLCALDAPQKRRRVRAGSADELRLECYDVVKNARAFCSEIMQALNRWEARLRLQTWSRDMIPTMRQVRASFSESVMKHPLIRSDAASHRAVRQVVMDNLNVSRTARAGVDAAIRRAHEQAFSTNKAPSLMLPFEACRTAADAVLWTSILQDVCGATTARSAQRRARQAVRALNEKVAPRPTVFDVEAVRITRDPR